ncbi:MULTISPECIES: S53 family peptidase [unclassified Mycolicibacterium]|uniref:S53 family peptidase n=1 Tax=unclassified Mycolicibacterium TaxID=2636767 RepID=UPI0012DBDBFA|nr:MULTISPECIES: S53 family peptidase [unclassified Mycolicibacterium]MUL81214.1 peptidase S53 [Mycolicibacterium sp. CBMA 329]MUL86980.1 peptidase S53 [Mycolicibacterium sp. CBMA 331]MUL98737.1 peptidase S53 [Mycolicibacterium sp. CBMA 334]MUM25599.1 peptidase S53 [Mycolicibacterium sp. CBMA 295]MUM37277.1 peptidase S53 [Mycolicibacterium sp. CBMA 247]
MTWPRVVPGYAFLALAMAGILLLTSDLRVTQTPGVRAPIRGPYAQLLAASTDLGPAESGSAQLTLTLHGATRPAALYRWADAHALSVRWRPGEAWAITEGEPADMATAFGVDIHDYRGRRGQEFYASPQQPSVPEPLRGEVTEVGRILGYTPYRMSRPDLHHLPLDVPDRGLTPQALLNTYNLAGLARQGFTGKGSTIVIFAFDGYDQNDLDTFATTFALPTFTPTLVGGQPSAPHGETTMDLQVAHAIAPDARKVVINARPTVQGDGAYEKIGQLLESADQQFPGAVWSFSIGWGCDKLITAADLAPVRSALAAAHTRGTTAFNASGDLAGLECKGGQDWSSPPGDDDIGLDSVASLPEITDVGGTTLSTDSDGGWLAEQAWFDVPLTQGTGGGVSAIFDRPPWQRGLSAPGSTEAVGVQRRLTPDVAAVADPFTGVKIVLNNRVLVGGGTSQSAPLWAGMAAVMNQYLLANGGRELGDLNPMLYRIAAGAPLPAFHDVTLGGNAVANAGPGYDLVTGLGTPNVENLVKNILVLQKSGR